MIWGAIGTLGIILLVTCTWGVVNARHARQANVLHALQTYNSNVLGYEGYSVDTGLSVVVAKTRIDNEYLNDFKERHGVTAEVKQVYNKLYIDISSETDFSIEEMQGMADELIKNGYECIEFNSSFVACSSEPTVISIDELSYYDATDAKDADSETILRSLQVNLYDSNYMIYLFESGYIIVTPGLGDTYRELQESDIGSYYYTMCLLRLFADNGIYQPFTSMMDNYYTIINISEDSSMK